MKSVLKNKLVVVSFSLVVVVVLSFFVSGMRPSDSTRSLASQGFRFDKELSDLASRRVIQELKAGEGVKLGSSPSELEKFLFEDLKGEFSLEVEPERAFRLNLINGRSSTVKVNNEYEFVKKALGFLFDKTDSYTLTEKKRDPASSEKGFDFMIMDSKQKVQAEVKVELNSSSHLKSLVARVP